MRGAQHRPPRGLVLALGAVVALSAVAALVALPARADGDPASDILASDTLLFDNVFLPLEPVSAALAQELRDAVAAANKSGFRIKVALIASPIDLGSVSVLFNMPGQYAKFLGAELRVLYKERLLVVMPAGFGFFRGGMSTASETAVLDTITIGSGPDGLAQAAIDAVKLLDDTEPPSAKAQTGSAKRGRTALLRYAVADNSGVAGATLTLARGRKLIATFSAPLQRLHGSAGAVAWKVPKGIALGVLAFCVVGVDAAGNRSKQSCVPFRVR
jgi:hypothetical protein